MEDFATEYWELLHLIKKGGGKKSKFILISLSNSTHLFLFHNGGQIKSAKCLCRIVISENKGIVICPLGMSFIWKYVDLVSIAINALNSVWDYKAISRWWRHVGISFGLCANNYKAGIFTILCSEIHQRELINAINVWTRMRQAVQFPCSLFYLIWKGMKSHSNSFY